jgi:glycosyltransferase involved in cell wall biosynthesis
VSAAARVAVVIPAYDAEAHLAATVGRLRQARVPGLAAVIIVDDGSRDGTRAVARALAAADPEITVVERPGNGGYGAAMKDGLAAARAAGAEVVACVHADGQYSPEALPRLLEERARRALDVLQGSRIAGGAARAGGMPLYKYAGNAVLNRLENGVLGLALSDYHSGYLIYGRRALEQIPFGRLSDSFDFDLEVLAAARARGLTVGEAPIPTHYGDEVSHLNPLTYGLRVLRVLWRYGRGHYA